MLRVIQLRPGDVFEWLESDGQRMAFVSAEPVGDVRLKVTVTDVDGSNRRAVTLHRHVGVRVITPRRD